MTDTRTNVAVEDARRLIEDHVGHLSVIGIDVQDAVGYVVAEDVLAPISLPSFAQSAMDGFAIGMLPDGNRDVQWKIVGEVKAGDTREVVVGPGEAFRIFTGAMVPGGTFSIVRQEDATWSDWEMTVHVYPNAGSNIRHVGGQVAKGDVALPKGTLLGPAGVGFLTGLGMTRVSVYAKPKIGLVVTGSELVKSGEPLRKGQVYETNSVLLHTALTSAGYETTGVRMVEDDLEATCDAIRQTLQEADVVIVSGGISVGEYDFVQRSLEALNVHPIFYKINQKPGKPMFFGLVQQNLLFALPGNPAAVLMCYYQYVLPALRKMSGYKDGTPAKRIMSLKQSFRKKDQRAWFLKAKTNGNQVEILEKQGSDMLMDFALADAVVYIPAERTEVEAGGEVEVFFLP
ncbi:MAG: molybdopterin molybdotransferase MoeA [Flavobacteriales bacterium]|nr:molybdopterin molybdotransferase MoeA [Flavobacteriales bacterium]MCB9447292.1 molybdopterin molybdotransferase MoeA [Flavobacteriales bacterium]